MTALTAADAERFERTIAEGGIAIFPTDTLYGIACEPDSRTAAERVYELKGRPPRRPSAVMFFDVARLLAALPELDETAQALVGELLPGPFTLVVANPRGRFAPACAGDPGKLGVRVPALAGGPLAPLRAVARPVMQTSANFSGGADPASLDEIEPAIRSGVDLTLDGGRLPGVGSTVADISELAAGRWRLPRAPIAADAARLRALIGRPPVE